MPSILPPICWPIYVDITFSRQASSNVREEELLDMVSLARISSRVGTWKLLLWSAYSRQKLNTSEGPSRDVYIKPLLSRYDPLDPNSSHSIV